ncbi:MAG: DUF3375 domain-containing protein [Pseudonocardiaceae bacterium]
MSDIEAEGERVRHAFDRPTLRLLDRKWAPFVLSVFRSSFSRDIKQVKADRLHAQVDAYKAELAGVTDTQSGNGRSLCLSWMHDQWLTRSLDDEGEEVYALTSHALEAMHIVENLAHERALISESRLTTILDAVRRWAMEANPDREDRIRRLDIQIATLQAERDRLAEGGEIVTATDEQMLNGYQDLIDLIQQLPGDFRRVEEALARMHRKMISDFRHEERPKGDVIDDYIERSEQLASQTPEGRAYEGALAILQDTVTLSDLRRDLERIVSHPFAVVLTREEKRDFVGAAAILRRGSADVQQQRRRLSATLREHLASHDHAKDRELDALLRSIERELETWMKTARTRDTVPLDLLPGTMDVATMRLRFYDPESDRPPPSLADVSDEAPEPPTLAEIRQQGGPLLHEVRRQVADALSTGAETFGEAFGSLAPDLRRPVEVFGLLQLATDLNALERAEGSEVYTTIRPDSTRRRLSAPRIRAEAEELRSDDD